MRASRRVRTASQSATDRPDFAARNSTGPSAVMRRWSRTAGAGSSDAGNKAGGRGPPRTRLLYPGTGPAASLLPRAGRRLPAIGRLAALVDDVEQFDLEHEVLIRADHPSGPFGPVGERGRDVELVLRAD